VIRFEPLMRCEAEGCGSVVEPEVGRREFHRDKGCMAPEEEGRDSRLSPTNTAERQTARAR
jgi:hypothetical protein